MSRPRNRYRNSLDVPWLTCTIVLGALALAFGCCYVYLKNQHHVKASAKLALQQETREMREEIEDLRSRIALARNREQLRARLRQFGIELAPISPGVIEHVEPASADPPAATMARAD